MVTQCLSSINVVRLRAVRLDANFDFATGTENSIVSDALTELTVNPLVLAGQEITQRNGTGDLCVDYREDDRPRSQADLSMSLCLLDAALLELMTGGSALMSGDDVIGFEPRGSGDGAPPPVALEVWEYAWDGEERAQDASGDVLYFRHAFPLTRWTVGQQRFVNGAAVIPINGKAKANTNFGQGPAGDWPSNVAEPGSFIQTTAIPDAACGYVDTTIVGS